MSQRPSCDSSRSLSPLSLISCVLPLLLTITCLIGCDDEPSTEVTAGEATAGETTAGETTAGETTSGETTAGETTAGETTSGETTAGETTAGETTAGETTAGETTAGETTAGAETMTGLPLSELIPQAAAALCQGLIGCCDMNDHEAFFLYFLNNPRYEEILDQLPPTVALTEESCTGMMETVLTTAPFGRWVEQVNEGRVSYHGEAAQTCLDTLNNAQCGGEFLSALNDGTCLSAYPPFGGESQRKMFSRTAPVGSDCVALSDGQGAVVYGTCDPNVAFCCVRREDGSCKLADTGDVGECVAVSERGEACSILPTVQVCRTGDECGYESGTCEAASEFIDVQEGETCAEGFDFFGNCINSYCDLGASNLCIPLKADGETCTFAEECVNGACVDQVCGPDNFCRR